LTAAAIAAGYLIVAPRSEDLAAHLLRTKLFATEGFGLWNNWWYGGHNVLSYSVLFPPLAALLTPQLVAAISVPVSAALFESLVHRRFGEDAWLGALWFAIGASTNLFTGRLTFALGLAFAVGTALALQRERPATAAALAALTALASPVDALFAALAGAAQAIGAYLNERHVRPALPGIGVIVAALAPVLALAIAFPEGGSEPFAFSAFWPIPLLAGAAFLASPREPSTLRVGIALYALLTLASYLIATPLGSNAARLGTLVAAPLAALLLMPRRPGLLVLVAAPLLYVGWQAPVRDLATAWGDPSVSTSYYQPLLRFLERQPGPPFRVEIPFTRFHWEAYVVASRVPLARGWERQLDTKDNALFYGGRLTASSYHAWLHRTAVRYVAVPDAALDYSAQQETRLIDRGLPYLVLALRTAHWRVYAVRDATPIAQGSARLQAIGPDWIRLDAARAGTTLLRVHFTPYWALARGSGCVAPAGDFTRVTLRRAGQAELAVRFAIDRIRASSARCS
jgi:hypothetical protein